MIYLLALMLIGCSSGEEESLFNPDASVQFSSTIGTMSKATDTGFESNDAIGVFAFKNANGFTDDAYMKNVRYVYNGNLFTSTDGISYPSGNQGLSFYAVYPYTASAASQFSFSVNADQSIGKNYTQSDLMTATTGVTTAEIPNLKFAHRLCNIVVNLNFDKVPSGNIDAIFNAKRSATVNLPTNSFVGTGTQTSIKATSNGTNSFKVILPPQTITNGMKFANIVINGVTYTWTLTRDIVFKSGIQHTYSLTVDNNTKTISFTGEIDPWGEEPKIETVVPPAILDKLKPYIPIYEGVSPPVVNGAYIFEPMIAVYCEDGVYSPGTEVNSQTIRFSNQNNSKLTLDYDGKSDGITEKSTGVYVSGSGDNFTAYFNTVGTSQGISTKTALVISGTKASTGIRNIRYAFVMVEKGSDPEHKLMAEGVFRVFKDRDELAQNTNWSALKSLRNNNSLLDMMGAKKD